MELKLIGLDQSVADSIKEFDEQQFHDIVKYINELDADEFVVDKKLYESKYQTFPDESQKAILDNKLNILKSNYPLLETHNQGNDYEWVYINRAQKGGDSLRFYFGINPMNMYQIVEKLTEKFVSRQIPVSFKYQQVAKKNDADRIILYTNSQHREEVEKAINDVYNENKELFDGSERILPWIFQSKTPNVYITPEGVLHDKSYGESFTTALLDSKKIFHYLYQEDRVKDQSQLEMLKKIVISTLLRNGTLFNKNGLRMYTAEPGIKTFYDKNENCLKNVIDNKNEDYYEVRYDSSLEGKKAFLKNFYTVKEVQNQPGVQARTLSRAERNQEVHNFLYPQTTNVVSK